MEPTTEQGKLLAGLVLAVILLQGSMAQTQEGSVDQSQEGDHLLRVDDRREDGSVLLTCDLKDENVRWFKNGKIINNSSKNTWNLGSIIKDPRGVYHCEGSRKRSKPLHIYYRMCQNCIEVNTATISGFIFAEIISIFFLAVGVYLIAGHEGAHQSRASDKQTLLPNDQLYQPLKDREDDQYSHLQGNPLKKK